MSQPPGWDPNQNPYGQGGPGYGQTPQYPGQQPPQGPPPGPPYGPPQGPPPQGPPQQGPPQQGPPQQGPPQQGPPSGGYPPQGPPSGGFPQQGPPQLPPQGPPPQQPPPNYGPPSSPYGQPPQYGQEHTQQMPPYGGPEHTQQLPQPPFGGPMPGGPQPPFGGPPGYLGPPMPPPKRSNRAPLLIGLAVLLIGALTAGIIVFANRDKKDNQAGGPSTATPSVSVTLTGLPTESDTPTESDSPSDSPSGSGSSSSGSGSDSQAPSDDDARSVAEEFMSNLKDKFYSLARLELCDAGQSKFTTGAALQKELGLTSKSVATYTLLSVKPGEFNGDPRKEVDVKVSYTPTGSETLTLSITQEHSEASVCGF